MGAGRIIFLNGCSSAGKTTLAIMLQQLLEEPYQHIALDQFRDGMPGKYRGLNSPSGTPGNLGLNVVPMKRMVNGLPRFASEPTASRYYAECDEQLRRLPGKATT